MALNHMLGYQLTFFLKTFRTQINFQFEVPRRRNYLEQSLPIGTAILKVNGQPCKKQREIETQL